MVKFVAYSSKCGQSQSGIAIDPTGTGITMFRPGITLFLSLYEWGIRIGSPRDKLLTTMERYLSTSTSASSDDIILAPYWINPKATDASKNIEEFKLQGKHHLRCKALMKGPKNAKPRSSPIWKWGGGYSIEGLGRQDGILLLLPM